MKVKTRLSLSMSPEALEMLDAAAKAHGISRSRMCERSVRGLLFKKAESSGAPPFLLSVHLPAVYIALLDALREIRSMPDWEPSKDRQLLGILEDYYNRMSESDQEWSDAQSWRGWPQEYDERKDEESDGGD